MEKGKRAHLEEQGSRNFQRPSFFSQKRKRRRNHSHELLGLLSLGTTRVGRWGTERAQSDRGESMAANGGDQSDAVAIPTELSVKHPLQNAWVLWFDNPVKRLGAKDWSSNLKKVPGHPIILWACTPACLWPCPCLWRGPVPSLAAAVVSGTTARLFA